MADRFAALGAPARVQLLRLLVRAGGDGLTVGELQKHSGLALSTQAHHLNALVRAGLVVQEKVGREVRSRVDYRAVQSLGTFLIERCCEGVGGCS
ncbi:metalloregulator ArsR/SmtB family transcription factor [Caulobacter sp. 17J65-9]|uniref:ArsR/SmtB family transcription factor n=1 Tax=Caulobacter sp. 17J65-9 TaxID=2709382 RepID=UPI0013CA39DA|nr:metalloregulator ArsR/SmtB family transcription factor [Caulobacter sp. 17J65-9]NEX91258.1 helix-turn-helix transcriptional regulator [Caulobacter sp. 17J65-9]